MKILLLPLFFFLAVASNVSYAQNSIFAGKIVDDNNPVPRAIIKISSKSVSPVEAKSDTDGLYCTKPIATGHYHLAVFLKNECRGLKKVTLDEASGSNKFFFIKMLGGNIAVNTVETDPAMAVKLAKIEDADYHNTIISDPRGGVYKVKFDSTGKVKSIQSPGADVPQMK